jgi:Na+/proline symporter
MGAVDLVIVGIYLLGLLALGACLARRAGSGAEAYFLGGRGLPWWALGSSGMSSNLDVAGTMTLVALFYLFGLHALFIEMRGGVVLPIAVFAAFMGAWHRRSGVMTTAEWMLLRFGRGPGGRAARTTAALTYVIITIGMVVFFLGAAGKFLSGLLPFTEFQCQAGLLAVALVYTMMSGLQGVVWTDVFQAALIGLAALYVAVVGAGQLEAARAAGWPGASWNFLPPTWQDPGLRVGGLDYSAFGWLLLAWGAKGVLEGLGGSGGSAYMAQRFYAARNETDCRKIGLLWTVLFACRWPMVAGFAILAAVLGVGADDPERILPAVLASDFFPPGVRGLVVAAMLAAAMSTFDSTINAGASYLVNDCYQPLRPRAGGKELVAAGWAASALITGLGLVLALQVESVVGVWTAIVIHLFPAFLVPFALRWYWGRMNGWGFTAGVAAGFAAALAVFWGARDGGWNEAAQLGAVAAVSLVATVAGSLLTPAMPETVGRVFYDQVRPFGLWPKSWRAPWRQAHAREVVDGLCALTWQMATFLLPLAVVFRLWGACAVLAPLWLALTWRLWPRDAAPPGGTPPGSQ